MTEAEAVALYESRFWEQMTQEEIAKFQLIEERLCVPFEVFHKAIEETLGRPVFTHEFGLNREGLIAELFHGAPAPSFDEIVNLLPKEKLVMVNIGGRLRMSRKIGDKVRIRSEELVDEQTKAYAGQEAKVVFVDYDGTFRLDVDRTAHWWTERMLDPDYSPPNSKEGPLSGEEAVMAMVRDSESLYDKHGGKFWFNKEMGKFMYDDPEGGVVVFGSVHGLSRSSKKRKRDMTRWEMLDWANSEESRGWFVRMGISGSWHTPQFGSYELAGDKLQRARLLPDISGIDESSIQGFEVEE
jgi:hypothetical protein